MTPRSPTDLCLLCGINPADKTASHIIPRLMTNTMFGTPRRGHLMGTHTQRRSEIIQDSAKEDYLFCSGCETRFSRIERYVANEFFNKYRNPVFQKDFPITYRGLLIPAEMDTMQALKVNQGIMRLFIYSLLWRASISSKAGFKTFKLESHVEERLRIELNVFLTTSIRDTLKNCVSCPIQSTFAYNIITCLELNDSRANFITPIDLEDGKVLLIANDFMFIFYVKGLPDRNYVGYNLDVKAPEITLFKLSHWKRFGKNMANFFAEARLRQMGETS